MRRLRRLSNVLAYLAAAAAVAGVVVGVRAGLATGHHERVVAGADDGGSVVEDFSYPGAAAILTAQNVKVISGDGHVMLVDCATTTTGDIGLVKVRTSERIGVNGRGLLCFQVTAVPGLVTMQVPAVYEIRGDGLRSGAGHAMTALVTTDDGQLPPVTVDPDGNTQVGVGADPDNKPTTLLELRATA